jgi:pyruvate-formate lyase-activating enzyme
MTITSSKKQEDKIVFLGNTARELFPEISIKSFEEAFEQGVKAALRTHGYKQWSDVVSEQPVARKTFFDSILKESRVYLKNSGLKADQIVVLLQKLNKKNRRYLG